MRIESSLAASDCLSGAFFRRRSHTEKAQKFKVLAGSVCSSHGFGWCAVASSAGSTVDSSDSSEMRSCHILKLLSRP